MADPLFFFAPEHPVLPISGSIRNSAFESFNGHEDGASKMAGIIAEPPEMI